MLKLNRICWFIVRFVSVHVDCVLISILNDLPPIATFLVYAKVRLRITHILIPVVSDKAGIACTKEMLHYHVDAMSHMHVMKPFAATLGGDSVKNGLSDHVEAI